MNNYIDVYNVLIIDLYEYRNMFIELYYLYLLIIIINVFKLCVIFFIFIFKFVSLDGCFFNFVNVM